MRDISPQLLASIASGATTFCSCWRLTRRDGIVLGFTDHDRDINFEGAVFAAMSGLESSAFESSAGLSVGGAEVSGALSAQALSEADLSNGLFDGARVEVFRVDWSAPENRVLLEAGVIGEVRRSEHAFTAELRSLAHELDQERGRLYQAGCDADVGDARCGFAFSNEPFVVEAQALPGSDNMQLVFQRADVPGADVPDNWFTGGRVDFLDNGNAGARLSVRAHRSDADTHVGTLWSRLGVAPSSGDRVRLYAGCDKSFDTCRVKFANSSNFRGFPHMPGNDHVMSYGKRGAGMDGGSLVR
jgi:uncharacterized phage protein (TIGR02218 family)